MERPSWNQQFQPLEHYCLLQMKKDSRSSMESASESEEDQRQKDIQNHSAHHGKTMAGSPVNGVVRVRDGAQSS